MSFTRAQMQFFILVALASSALSCRSSRFLKFASPVTIDFYGLIHRESAETANQTVQNIENVLDSHPYDLVSIEYNNTFEQLEWDVETYSIFVQFVKLLAFEHQKDLPNGLENLLILEKRRSAGLRHFYTAVRWARDHGIPYVSVDPRNNETLNSKGEPYNATHAQLYENRMKVLMQASVKDLKEIERTAIEILARNRQRVSQLYRDTCNYYENPTDKNLEGLEILSPGARFLLSEDPTMAKKMAAAIKKYGAARVAHFGGAAHFVSHPELDTLFEIMGQYATTTRTLLSAEPKPVLVVER